MEPKGKVMQVDRKRRVKPMEDASKASNPNVEDAKKQSRNTRDDAQRHAKKGANLRLGVGLGAAGLASGFAASHFEGGFELVWKSGWIRVLGAEDGRRACGGRGVSRRWIACWWWGAATAYKDGAGVLWCARSTGGLARDGALAAVAARGRACLLRKITLASLNRPLTRACARPSMAA